MSKTVFQISNSMINMRYACSLGIALFSLGTISLILSVRENTSDESLIPRNQTTFAILHLRYFLDT